jgi:hypothetical protein
MVTLCRLAAWLLVYSNRLQLLVLQICGQSIPPKAQKRSMCHTEQQMCCHRDFQRKHHQHHKMGMGPIFLCSFFTALPDALCVGLQRLDVNIAGWMKEFNRF